VSRVLSVPPTVNLPGGLHVPPLENTRFTKIEYISSRNHIHSFCLYSRPELDREVLAWVRLAYPPH
jgi:hypothetical protein